MVNQRLAEQENTDSLPIFQFANLAQHEWPLTCSCTDFPKIILHRSYHTVIITVQRQEERKNIRKGNEIRKKEQSNQNILAVSPEGLAESSSILPTPGNPCPGMATGRLPAAASHQHDLTSHSVMGCFPKPHRGDAENGLL